MGLTVLAACSEPEVILPGERFGTREVLQEGGPAEAAPVNTTRALSLAASRVNAGWAQSRSRPLRGSRTRR